MDGDRSLAWAYRRVACRVRCAVVARAVLLLVASRLHRRGTQPAQPAIPPDQTEAIVKALGGLVGEHKAGTLVAALLAGAAAEQAARRR